MLLCAAMEKKLRFLFLMATVSTAVNRGRADLPGQMPQRTED